MGSSDEEELDGIKLDGGSIPVIWVLGQCDVRTVDKFGDLEGAVGDIGLGFYSPSVAVFLDGCLLNGGERCEGSQLIEIRRRAGKLDNKS